MPLVSVYAHSRSKPRSHSQSVAVAAKSVADQGGGWREWMSGTEHCGTQFGSPN